MTAAAHRAGSSPAARGMAPAKIISFISLMPASPLNGNASLRTNLQPLYSPGLCDAVICAPPSRLVGRHGVIHLVGAHQAVVEIVPPCSTAPSMNALVSDGDDTRMSRVTA